MIADPFGLIGTIVDGRYRVERVAGQGGFGIVYRAHHLGFESPIALKILKLPERWTSAARTARIANFQREGRMLFELSLIHPSIVRAFETGTVTGPDGSPAPYLALEWLDGVSLEHEIKLRRRKQLPPLSLHQVLNLLSAPAQGLARAHARGIAHRDIKPGNLFLSVREAEPSVKILDFGIAKAIDETSSTSEQFAETDGLATSFTPMYAAPEQWLRRLGATGTWTDVHALALVCVELLSGRSPFSGGESAQFMAACLDPQRRPTPGAAGVRLSPSVEAVFARAVSLEPRSRCRDIGEFWSALCSAAGWSESEALAPAFMGSISELSLAELTSAPASRAVAPSSSTTAATAVRVSGYQVAQRLRLSRRHALVIAASAVAVAGVAVRALPEPPQSPPQAPSRHVLPAVTSPLETRIATATAASSGAQIASTPSAEAGASLSEPEPSAARLRAVERTATRAPAKRIEPASSAKPADSGPQTTPPDHDTTRALAPAEPATQLGPEMDLDDPALAKRR
ncbi:MAG TPA: serine/threonine-protein kinase [Polyangiaceae bacterium]|nr:serine/threonine-protein kinase [Polyangiaceae bacterium]